MSDPRKSSRQRKAGSGGFFLFNLDFWGHSLLKVLVAALVVAGGWMLLAMARSRAVRLPEFHVSPSNLNFVSKPSWVRGPIERQLSALPDARGKISLLDSRATSKVAAHLSGNPWIKEVKSVVRDFPDRIRARVELREPAAFVLRNSKYYLVDANGMRLPGEYRDPTETGLDLLLVVFVRSTPPPAGKVWDDPAVVEGARVAAFLKKHEDTARRARISAVDSSNIGGRRTPRESEITLLTLDQTKIYWGKGLSAPVASELSPDSKIESLKAVLDQQGTIADKEYVDLRFPNPVFRDRNLYVGGV